MTNEKILDKIKAGFDEVQRRTDIKRQKDWTQAFFDVLKSSGIENGFKVYSGSVKEKIGLKKGGGEWLFDLCWSIEGEKDDWKNQYKGLKLICECEWATSEDEILYDFQKLAVGKAELKIMMVQYKDEDNFKDIQKSCEESVDSKLHEDGAIYTLVGCGNGIDENEVKWVKLWSGH